MVADDTAPPAGPAGRAARRARSRRAPVLAGLLGLLGLLGLVGLVGALGPGAEAPAGAQEAPTSTDAGSTSTVAPLLPGEPAVAVDGCEEVLHDPDRALGDDAPLRAAIDRVGAQGVALRVRVDWTMPGAGEVVALERRCGWRPGGTRDPRSLLLVVSPAAEDAGLWPGADLLAPVAGRFAAVRDRVAAEADLGTADGVAGLVDEIGALAAAEPAPDPLGCEQLVWDPEGTLEGDPTVTDAALALQADGHDLRVRVEPPTDGDIDARLAQLEDACPGWQVDGDRPARRVIVVVQPSSRSTGLWYGRDASDLLADRWEAIQTRTMNPRFRAGDVAGGLADGLDQLTRSSPGPARPFATDLGSTGSDGAGSAVDRRGVPGAVVALGLLFVGAWFASYLNWRSKVDAGETTESFGSYSRSRSTSARRSGSGRSGSGRRSSGRGGRRSSGGGRRSGGGSTRW